MVRALVGPIDGLTAAQRIRYSRQILLEGFGEEGQRRLLGARMLVVGAGGLGSPALLYLAAAGVGTIGIVDDDAVDLSNLHRQVIHDSAGVGSSKTSSAAARVRALNPDVTVLEHRERLTEATARQIVAGYDIVVDGSDNFPTRYLVDAVCSELSIPEVWGSVLRCTAQISVFWTGPRARAAGVPDPVCLRDLFPGPPPPGSTPGCGEAGVIGPLCGQAGSIMAGEAIKLATGMGDPLIGRILVVDMMSATSQTVPLSANPNRPSAGQKAPDGACPARSEVPEITVHDLAGIVGQARRRSGEVGRDSTENYVTGKASHASDRQTAGAPVTAASGLVAILDVREPHEREICAIDGSIHIPLAEVLADPEGVAERIGGGRVYVHCLSGGRSMRAVRALRAVGVDAVNVAGGIKAWWTEVNPSMPRY